MRPTTLPKCFKFDVIRFTGYRFIAEKPRVSFTTYFFRAPCRKNCALDRKLIDTLVLVLMFSITTQSLGEIEQCEPAVGAKIGYLYVSIFIYRQLPRSGNLLVLCLLSSQKSTFLPPAEKLWIGSKNDTHLIGWARRALPPCTVWERSNNALRLLVRKCGVCFFCHAPSPERCMFEGCIVWTSIASRFMGRFQCGFQRFFRKRSVFQMHYIVRISAASWRHNFRKIFEN